MDSPLDVDNCFTNIYHYLEILSDRETRHMNSQNVFRPIWLDDDWEFIKKYLETVELSVNVHDDYHKAQYYIIENIKSIRDMRSIHPQRSN